MSRKRAAHSSTKKSSRPPNLKELEEHLGLLLLLVQHNLDKVFRRKRAR